MSEIGGKRIDQTLLMIYQQRDGAIEPVYARRCSHFALLQIIGALAIEQLEHGRAAGFLHGRPPF